MSYMLASTAHSFRLAVSIICRFIHTTTLAHTRRHVQTYDRIAYLVHFQLICAGQSIIQARYAPIC